MTHLEKYASLIAEGTTPRKPRTRTQYVLEQQEEAARSAIHAPEREVKHRDQVPVMRRLDAANSDEVGGEIGAKVLAALRRKGIPTTPISRLATDTIGRMVPS